MATDTSQTTHDLTSALAPKVKLHPSFRGFISGVVNADLKQRAFLEVKDQDGSTITSATFEGQGERKHLQNTFNNSPHWSFGPFTFDANLFITIFHSKDGKWKVSKMVGPLAITKDPEIPDYPMTFHVSTVISEDGVDESHDDCTVKVLQYK